MKLFEHLQRFKHSTACVNHGFFHISSAHWHEPLLHLAEKCWTIFRQRDACPYWLWLWLYTCMWSTCMRTWWSGATRFSYNKEIILLKLEVHCHILILNISIAWMSHCYCNLEFHCSLSLPFFLLLISKWYTVIAYLYEDLMEWCH